GCGGAGAAAAELGEVLAKSAFDRLHSMAGDDHRGLLRRQRRMPKALSDCVSEVFYAGRLCCAHIDRDADPLFRSRLVMIDTADRPPMARRQRRRGSPEARCPRGYAQSVGARLSVCVVAPCERAHADCGSIVAHLPTRKE